jgi:hypothetical protein
MRIAASVVVAIVAASWMVIGAWLWVIGGR